MSHYLGLCLLAGMLALSEVQTIWMWIVLHRLEAERLQAKRRADAARAEADKQRGVA